MPRVSSGSCRTARAHRSTSTVESPTARAGHERRINGGGGAHAFAPACAMRAAYAMRAVYAIVAAWRRRSPITHERQSAPDGAVGSSAVVARWASLARMRQRSARRGARLNSVSRRSARHGHGLL